MFAILCSKLSQQQDSSSKSKVFLKHPLSIEQLPLAPQPGGEEGEQNLTLPHCPGV
jgi:hypothetical protein